MTIPLLDITLRSNILKEQIRLSNEISALAKKAKDLQEVHRLTPLYVGVMYYVASVGRAKLAMIEREMMNTCEVYSAKSLDLVLTAYLRVGRLRKEGEWYVAGVVDDSDTLPNMIRRR